MTTDNFTEAARAEAERRYNRIARRNKTADEWLDEGRASGFTSGAEWARTHLAAQEVTDAEVIAALGAANRTTLTGQRFDAPLSFYSDATVKAMRAALSAARAARREPCAECGHTDQHKFSCSHREGHGATIPARRDEEKR